MDCGAPQTRLEWSKHGGHALQLLLCQHVRMAGPGYKYCQAHDPAQGPAQGLAKIQIITQWAGPGQSLFMIDDL